MRLYIPVVSPRFLDFLEFFSPLGKGGDGKCGISNITLAPFIISWEPMDEYDEAHEGIHVMQQLECWVVGSLVAVPLSLVLGAPLWGALLVLLAGIFPGIGWFYWLYYATYIYWTARGRRSQVSLRKLNPGQIGYYLIPFEREAYLYDQEGLDYFSRRKWFTWVSIKDHEVLRDGAEVSEHLFMMITTNKTL